VPYFAAALARSGRSWAAYEMDLDGVADVDELADLVREVVGDAGTAVLFVEEDDEYVGIMRVDAGGEEPRVFLSDARAAAGYPAAALLVQAAGVDAGSDEDAAPDFDIRPSGDAALLADLGVPASDLLALVSAEGELPADVITEVCERAGCLDELEALRPVT
jgi:putative tRNA adenosine deaminase-associated protein